MKMNSMKDAGMIRAKGPNSSFVIKKLSGKWEHPLQTGNLHVYFVTGLTVTQGTTVLYRWDDAVIMIEADTDKDELRGIIGKGYQFLLTQIKKLHAADYSHGDVHEGNILTANATFKSVTDNKLDAVNTTGKYPYLTDYSYKNGSSVVYEQTLQNVTCSKKDRDMFSVTTIRYTTQERKISLYHILIDDHY